MLGSREETESEPIAIFHAFINLKKPFLLGNTHDEAFCTKFIAAIQMILEVGLGEDEKFVQIARGRGQTYEFPEGIEPSCENVDGELLV
jgi:hypothetical protein